MSRHTLSAYGGPLDDDDTEIEIVFEFTPGTNMATYNRIVAESPPDEPEVEFISARIVIGEPVDQAKLDTWAEQYLQDNGDSVNEVLCADLDDDR